MSIIDNPKRVQRKEIAVKIEDRQRLNDLGFVMSSAQGRRVINDLLKRCGVYRLSFAGPGQGEQTAFYEGQRNIGNYYLAALTKNFKNQWLLMTEEAEQKENQKENQNGRTDTSGTDDTGTTGNTDS